MLLFLCSFAADSMSRSMSFWPSTIATRSSSACVALKSMRFIILSPARTGRTNQGLLWRLVSHHRLLDHENALLVCRLGQLLSRTRRICRYAVGALFYYYLVNFTGWITNRLCGFGFLHGAMDASSSAASGPGSQSCLGAKIRTFACTSSRPATEAARRS